MTAFSLKATLLDSGRHLLLDCLREVELTASLGSPAASLRVKAAVDELPPELCDVTLYYGERELFYGMIDRQEARLSGEGRTLTLEARSKGALLLDNESRPRVLWGTNLGTMFRNSLEQYGFVLYNPQESRNVAVYSVGKGVSEWEAFRGLCMRMHSIEPYVEGDAVIVSHPRINEVLRFSNTGDGTPFCDICWEHLPYNIISSIAIRDENGSYSGRVDNSGAARYRVRRRRYMLPGTEFADAPGLDANQRIRRSMRERVRVRVTAPGIVLVRCGQPAQVVDAALTLHNLRVEQWRYRADNRGIFTELTLGDSVYI